MKQSLLLTTLGTSILLVGSIITLQAHQLSQSSSKIATLNKEEIIRKDRALQLRLKALQKSPSFGFDNLLADSTFLSFLFYFGDSDARDVSGYKTSPDFFKIIVDNDPRFYDPYHYLSMSVSLYSAQPEEAVALIDKGLRSMSPETPPESFYVWRLKATDELLFLGDGEQARQSFLEAADWARQSPHPEAEATIEMSERTAQYLAENPASRAAQFSAWAMVLSRTVDEESQRRAIEQIEALGGEIVVNSNGIATIRYKEEDNAK